MAVGTADGTVKDPICGKPVDALRARAVGIFGGVTYYFCSAECKAKFKDPRKAPRPEPGERRAAAPALDPDDDPPPSRPLDRSLAMTNDPHGESWDEDAPAPAAPSRRVWWLVAALFVLAGAVLFFAWLGPRPR